MKVKIIETPRDGFQGIPLFIPTAVKTEYINQLFKAGFEAVEMGSFVSPKAIPQMPCLFWKRARLILRLEGKKRSIAWKNRAIYSAGQA